MRRRRVLGSILTQVDTKDPIFLILATVLFCVLIWGIAPDAARNSAEAHGPLTGAIYRVTEERSREPTEVWLRVSSYTPLEMRTVEGVRAQLVKEGFECTTGRITCRLTISAFFSASRRLEVFV